MAETDPYFEQGMLMTFPTAENVEEAKEMFVYVSSVNSIEELKRGCDEARRANWNCNGARRTRMPNNLPLLVRQTLGFATPVSWFQYLVKSGHCTKRAMFA